MRPKLVVGVSLLASFIGAASCIGIVFAVFSAFNPAAVLGWLVLLSFLLPLATIIFATIFVYRHTAKRRKLQAFMTAVLATLLTLGLLVLATILSARRNHIQRPPVIQPHTAG